MPSTYTTKELSKRTWPDYVRFFSQGNGWDHCACTAFQGFRPPSRLRKWVEKRDWSLNVKCGLVEQGRAHGILVYAAGEPVGWCQFGPANELPIVEPGRRRQLFEDGEERLWRITCFCTRPDFSQQGIAGIALQAALKAIAKRGGGIVEARPIAHVRGKGDPAVAKWFTAHHRLTREHGRDSEEVRRHLATAPPGAHIEETEDGVVVRRSVLDKLGGGREIEVDGVGKVNAIYWGRFYGGTVTMFERAGFRAVDVVPPSSRRRDPGPYPTQVVMRKTISAP